LFNIFVDGVVKEVNTRVMERGVALTSDSAGECQLNEILCADDTTSVADEEHKLQNLVGGFDRVCQRMKLCENVAKNNVRKVTEGRMLMSSIQPWIK
jgi:hypothetical protein